MKVFNYPVQNVRMRQALDTLLNSGYKLEIIPLKKIMDDNELADNNTLDYHSEIWGNNPDKYWFYDKKIDDWFFSDMMSAVKKKGKYELENGRHRCRALYNAGYTHIELPVYEEPANLQEEKQIINLSDNNINEKDIYFWKNPEDGNQNAIINFNGKRTRLRAGVLIVRNGDEVLLGEEEDEPGEFSLPGGGINPGEKIVDAAKREAEEEVKITVKNIQQTGYDYCECHDEIKPWVEKHVPKEYQWYNYYTCLCIGEYAGEYKGKIATVDLDKSMDSSSKFYKISEVIDDPSFKEQWKKALIKFGYLDKKVLTEDTRNQLIAKSRGVGAYKDQSRGKNRFERKKYSKVANQVKSFNTIDMNKFFKQDILEVTIPVTGETNNYDVVIKMEGVCSELARNIKSSGKLEYKTVMQAVTKVFNTANVYVKCSCDDFKYRYDHWSIVNNYGVNDSAHDPGPGKGIANPNNDKGIGCKHILLTLANANWVMHVTSCIKNYIFYAEEHMQPAFQKIIFPKLYGIPYDAADEENLVPEDTNLQTEKHVIELINDWAHQRGRIRPGSNKNPAKGKGSLAKDDLDQKNKKEDNKDNG